MSSSPISDADLHAFVDGELSEARHAEIAAWLADHDPPGPAALTNALGAFDDHLDDLDRAHGGLADVATTFSGATITSALGPARIDHLQREPAELLPRGAAFVIAPTDTPLSAPAAHPRR